MTLPPLPPVGPELELDEERQAALAGVLEAAGRTLAAVRYGTVFPVGAARVVLNPDSPLPAGGRAGTVVGSPGEVEATLAVLPRVFAEAGRTQVVLESSPSCAPELELLAEEAGWEAREETAVMLLTRPERLVEGEPGRITRLLRDEDEHLLAPLLATVHGWHARTLRRQAVVVGHRLDDPRHTAVAAYEDGELVGVATGFLAAPAGVGQLVDVAVLPAARSRGLGRALASGVCGALLARGAALVWLQVEAGGTAERGWGRLGFETAYEAVTWTSPGD